MVANFFAKKLLLAKDIPPDSPRTDGEVKTESVPQVG